MGESCNQLTTSRQRRGTHQGQRQVTRFRGIMGNCSDSKQIKFRKKKSPAEKKKKMAPPFKPQRVSYFQESLVITALIIIILLLSTVISF